MLAEGWWCWWVRPFRGDGGLVLGVHGAFSVAFRVIFRVFPPGAVEVVAQGATLWHLVRQFGHG